MNATADLLEFARAEHRLPEGARAAASRLLADTLTVGAAGAIASEPVEAAAARWGSGRDARLLGRGPPMAAPAAAFVNGFRIHCLEWDAVHEKAVVHALSVVTATLGAVIDRRGGCDPDAALAALAVGVDVASGLGIASTGAMRFFRPATAGVIGAALAAARIERIDAFEDVLGLAYSQAAGTMQAHVEGSIALPLQIANAARAALITVDLVGAGLSAPHDVLEGPYGYYSLFEQGDLRRYTSSIGRRWLIEDVSTKPFPSGRASHAALAALQDLRLAGGAIGDIEEVVLLAPPLVRRLVDRPMHGDMTPSYARLCLPFLAALMVRDGRIDPRRFTLESFRDPELAALASRVRVEPDDNEDPNALRPQSVSVKRPAGQPRAAIAFNTLGDPAMPMSPQQAAAKYDLARELAGEVPDVRIFDDPLAYFTEPR